MKVDYVFATPRCGTFKLGRMILPQLEADTHAVDAAGIFFVDDNYFVLGTGDPIGDCLSAIATEKNRLLMIYDMCALERGLAHGEPR